MWGLVRQMCDNIAAFATVSCAGCSIAIAEQRSTLLATDHGMCRICRSAAVQRLDAGIEVRDGDLDPRNGP